MYTPTVLTIAGFDPYGGAGIQIDTKTIHALGGYAFSAVTAVTAQNSQGVSGVEAVSPQMLHLQLDTLLKDVKVDAVKIGMLANASLVEVVSDVIEAYGLKNVVLDPVLVSSSGRTLLEPEAVKVMVARLFPLCSLVTPNLDETNMLLHANFKGEAKEISLMAEQFLKMGAGNILMKGGHTAEEKAVDYLVGYSGITAYATPRIHTSHTHGTGCLLSSAITTRLARGETLAASVKVAKAFLFSKLKKASMLHLSYTAQNQMRKEPVF